MKHSGTLYEKFTTIALPIFQWYNLLIDADLLKADESDKEEK